MILLIGLIKSWRSLAVFFGWPWGLMFVRGWTLLLLMLAALSN